MSKSVSKSAKRRARRLNVFIEPVNKRELWNRHNGICGICKTPVSFEAMTIEHCVPLSRGGLHTYANCAPAHESCNLDKGSDLPEDYVYPRAPARKPQYLNQPNLA